MKAPDLSEAIVGYRAWNVLMQQTRFDRSRPDRQFRFELHSRYRRDLWLPRRAKEARCDDSRHRAPKPDCSCGLYAIKTLGYSETANLCCRGVEQVAVGEVSL